VTVVMVKTRSDLKEPAGHYHDRLGPGTRMTASM